MAWRTPNRSTRCRIPSTRKIELRPRGSPAGFESLWRPCRRSHRVADRMHRCRIHHGRLPLVAYRGPWVQSMWRSHSRRQEQAAEVANGHEIPRHWALPAEILFRRESIRVVDIAVPPDVQKAGVSANPSVSFTSRHLAQKTDRGLFSASEENRASLRATACVDAVCVNQNMRHDHFLVRACKTLIETKGQLGDRSWRPIGHASDPRTGWP